MVLQGNKQNAESTLQVCMLTSRFYPDYSGGGRQALSLSKVLRKKGVDITVLTLDLKKSVWRHSIHVEYINNLPVYRTPAKIRMRIELLIRYCRFTLLGLSKRNSYSIIHAHGLLEGYVSWVIGKLTGKPVIVKLAGISEIVSRWYNIKGGYNWESLKITRRNSWRPDKFFYRWLIKQFDGIICTTDKLHAMCITAGVSKDGIYNIPNGVDTDRFHVVSQDERQKIRSSLGLDNSEFILGTALTLRPTKGLDILLKAIRKIPSDFKMRLIIIGLSVEDVQNPTSEFSKNVTKYLDEIPANVKIMFVGLVPDIQQYLSAIDGYVLPSRTEGFPNSALESMSSGLPCIFSEINWTKDIIEHDKNGVLYPAEDANSLAESIVRISKDVSLREKLGLNARKLVMERFSIDSVAESYIKLYQSIFNQVEDN